MVSGSTGLCTFNRKLILSFTAYFTTYQCADANASTALAESPHQLGAFVQTESGIIFFDF